MENTQKPKTLLIRMDKIGDLVVSLNAQDHPWFKNRDYHWIISHGLGWVLENSPHRKNYTEADKVFSFKGFFQLVRTLKGLKADSAVVFQAPWFVGLALVLAGVPQRVGRRSQWHSFLFFNQGVRQKRSLAEMHESAYNWELISKGLADAAQTPKITQPVLQAPKSINSLELPSSYCVIHPGMMGSALNWPVQNYIELTKKLSKHLPVVVTGTMADRPWTEPLQKSLSEQSNIHWLQEKMNPQQLLVTLAKAKFVVAPSTGIIHLASGLGTPVVGFYSPRLPERASRWGPLNENALLFTPPFDLVLNEDCMSCIEVDEVFTKISEVHLV